MERVALVSEGIIPLDVQRNHIDPPGTQSAKGLSFVNPETRPQATPHEMGVPFKRGSGRQLG